MKWKSVVKVFVLFFYLYLISKDQRETVDVKGFGRGRNKRCVHVRVHVVVWRGSYHCSRVLCHNTLGIATLSKIPTESPDRLCVTTDGWCVCCCAVCLCVHVRGRDWVRKRECEWVSESEWVGERLNENENEWQREWGREVDVVHTWFFICLLQACLYTPWLAIMSKVTKSNTCRYSYRGGRIYYLSTVTWHTVHTVSVCLGCYSDVDCFFIH